jgi:hypothetical protein
VPHAKYPHCFARARWEAELRPDSPALRPLHLSSASTPQIALPLRPFRSRKLARQSPIVRTRKDRQPGRWPVRHAPSSLRSSRGSNLRYATLRFELIALGAAPKKVDNPRPHRADTCTRASCQISALFGRRPRRTRQLSSLSTPFHFSFADYASVPLRSEVCKLARPSKEHRAHPRLVASPARTLVASLLAPANRRYTTGSPGRTTGASTQMQRDKDRHRRDTGQLSVAPVLAGRQVALTPARTCARKLAGVTGGRISQSKTPAPGVTACRLRFPRAPMELAVMPRRPAAGDLEQEASRYRDCARWP